MKTRMVAAAAACLTLLACTSDPSGPQGPTYSTTPPGPPWSGTAQMVAVGEWVNCLLATDGTPWCWGSPRHTQMRVDDGIRDRDRVNYTADWIRDSVCAANTPSGQMRGWPCIALHPVRMSSRSFSSISLSGWDSPLCAVDAALDAWCWDQQAYLDVSPDSAAGGIQYCGNTSCMFAPQKVRAGAPVRQLAAYRPCVLTTAGAVRCSGSNYYNQLSPSLNLGFNSESLFTIQSPVAFTAIAVSTNGNFLCGLAADNRAYCWGQNEDGAAGAGVYSRAVTVPTAVVTTQRFTSIVASVRSVCALTAGGTAWCWGFGGGGELGWNGLGASNVPVAVSGGHVFTSLASGTAHFCGLKANGEAWCWGYDFQGQIGADFGGSCPPVVGRCAQQPIRVAGGLSFRQLAGGTNQTCGVTTSNQVYCWGSTAAGRLGQQGITDVIPHPVQITP